VKAPDFLRRFVQKAYEQLKKVPASPQAVAGGAALGIFWAFTPLLGLKTALSVLSAWALRRSKIAAALAVSMHDVLTPFWPFFLRWEYDLGFWVLYGRLPRHLHAAALHLKYWLHWTTLRVLWPTFLGSLAFAVPSALVTYWVVDRSLRRYHAAHGGNPDPQQPVDRGD